MSSEERRFELKDLGSGFYRLIIRYGFMQETDVPAALASVESCGPQFKMMDTSFFLARQTLLTSARPGMAIWREKLFAWMLRNAESAMEFFKLPHQPGGRARQPGRDLSESRHAPLIVTAVRRRRPWLAAGAAPRAIIRPSATRCRRI